MTVLPRPLLKTALGHTLWPAVTRFASKRAIRKDTGLIYTFHHIGEPVIPGLCNDLFLKREAFLAILDFICKNLTPLAPLDFLSGLESGSLPPGATMLTFDDCTRECCTVVLPELRRRNLKACFFACPGLIAQGRTLPHLKLMDVCARAAQGKYDVSVEIRNSSRMEKYKQAVWIDDLPSRRRAYHQLWPYVYRTGSRNHSELMGTLRAQMGVADSLPYSYPLATWDELQQLQAEGHWVANHTMFHSTCHADSIEEFGSQVKHAFEVLEERFPAPRRIFCYPYGSTLEVSEETSRLLDSMNVDMAFVTQGGLARPSRDGMLRLHREDAAYSAGGAKLAPLLAMSR